jgi:hypothetical protein
MLVSSEVRGGNAGTYEILETGRMQVFKLEELRYGTDVKIELGERAISSQKQKASEEE